MYMLSCCLEGPGTPLSYSSTDEIFMRAYPRRGDAKGCGMQEFGFDLPESQVSAEEKHLTTADTTTTADDSSVFTDQCPAFKEVPGETTAQTAEEPLEPRETEPATTTAPPAKTESEKPHDTEATQTGVIYKGNYKDGKRHGWGILIRPCGSRFEGEFRDDAANGYGTFYHPSGDIYEGQWQNNKAHGKGRFTHADGSSYDGQWVMDIQEGYGVEQWADGSSYEGNYIGGKKSGEGRFRWPNGSTFHGQFQDNEINGEGVYQWKDGKIYSGRLTWPDGQYFEGEWEGGKQGAGRYFDAQGRQIETANDVPPVGRSEVSGSKASVSPHGPLASPRAALAGATAERADNGKQQLPAGKSRVVADVEQQQMQETGTSRVLDSGSGGSCAQKQTHTAEQYNLKQYDRCEKAEMEKAKKTKTQCSLVEHSAQLERSAPQHQVEKEQADLNSAVPAMDGGVTVFGRRGYRHECDGAVKNCPPQQREEECERHAGRATKEKCRQEGAKRKTKKDRPVKTASHSAGVERKRAFEGLFNRRK